MTTNDEGGGSRPLVFWVVWTIIQTFTLWLSVVQFGTIWLAWLIFGNKSPRPDPLSAKKVDPALEAERKGNQKREDDKFRAAFGGWVGHLSGVISSGRWIPKGTAERFLAKYPAPKHPHKTWARSHSWPLGLILAVRAQTCGGWETSFDRCASKKAFRRDWDLFRVVYARDVGKWGEPDEPEAYANGQDMVTRMPATAKAGDQCPACRRGVLQQKNGHIGPFLGVLPLSRRLSGSRQALLGARTTRLLRC